MTMLDEFASKYPDVYEFLVTLADKLPEKCNCEMDDGIAHVCTNHKAEYLLADLER